LLYLKVVHRVGKWVLTFVFFVTELACVGEPQALNRAGSAICRQASAKFYDEAYAAPGKLRPIYQRFFERTRQNALTPTEEATRFLSNHPLKDKFNINSIPLILANDEYAQIKRGVTQRARALSALFDDLALGQGTILWRYILPYDVIDRMLEEVDLLSLESLRQKWQGKSRRHINFLYGADIMRDSEGHWYVIEDNVSNIGGYDSLEFIFTSFRDARQLDPASLSAYFSGENAITPLITDFVDAHALTTAQAVGLVRLTGAYGTGSAEYYIGTNGYMPDDLSLTQVNRSLGRLDQLFGRANVNRLESDFLDFAGISNHIDAHGIKAVFNKAFPRWNTHNADVVTQVAPDTRMLSTKELLPYMDKLVEFYLGEKLELPTQPSVTVKVLAQAQTPYFKLDLVDERHRGRMDLDSFDDLVFKIPGSQGGEGVKIGRYEDIGKTWSAEGENWSRDIDPLMYIYVVQSYLEPSRLKSSIIDIRPIVQLANFDKVITSQVPWGRALDPDRASGSGNPSQAGLVNAGQNGYYLPVLVEQ